MSPASFQTARISRGSHRSPEDGACAMELASMIAGEPFSDRPRSVCRVIAAFLRAYNDVARDDERQDLYACASDVIGTRGSREIEVLRLRRCVEALDEISAVRAGSLRWRLGSPPPWRLLSLLDVAREGQPDEFMCGVARVLHAGGARGHELALALVETLVAIRAPQPSTSPMLLAFATASEREETSSLR